MVHTGEKWSVTGKQKFKLSDDGQST